MFAQTTIDDEIVQDRVALAVVDHDAGTRTSRDDVPFDGAPLVNATGIG